VSKAAALGLSVPVVGLVELEPNLNQSKPKLPRSLSSTPGPPPACTHRGAGLFEPSRLSPTSANRQLVDDFERFIQ
jgi:hypothetical protein